MSEPTTQSGRPRIFVSSTIYDFRDLRSALKHWLEKLGYDVQLSEYNDFQKDLDKNSYEECLAAIDRCQYFVLLVGGRVGGWYDKNRKVSITQMEYRHAYDRLKAGKLKIVSFVRREVWEIREDRKALAAFLRDEFKAERELPADSVERIEKHSSRFVSDAEHVFGFIDEVSRKKEMLAAAEKGEARPIGNWIHPFSNFTEVADGLERFFKTSFPLRRMALAAALQHEIVSNLGFLVGRYSDGVEIPPWAGPARKRVTGDIMGRSRLLGQHLGWLGMYCVAEMTFSGLATAILDEAIGSGEFLEFSHARDGFEVGPLQSALLRLRNDISYLKGLDSFFSLDERAKFVEENMRHLKTDTSRKAICVVENVSLAKVISIYDRHVDATKLCSAIYQTLSDGDASRLTALPEPPTSPFAVQAEEIRKEKVTPEEIVAWISGGGPAAATPSAGRK